jgi:hypothetical protein
MRNKRKKCSINSGLERHLSEEERAPLPLVLARTPLKYARHQKLCANATE